MDPLSIESASAIQQSKVAAQVATAVAKKSMDTQRSQGQAAVALIQQAANIGQQLAKGQVDVLL